MVIKTDLGFKGGCLLIILLFKSIELSHLGKILQCCSFAKNSERQWYNKHKTKVYTTMKNKMLSIRFVHVSVQLQQLYCTESPALHIAMQIKLFLFFFFFSSAPEVHEQWYLFTLYQ